MDHQDDLQRAETAPIPAAPSTPATFSTERVEATSWLPAGVVPPAAPVVTTPAGWYPLNGEQRYWDGSEWTDHRAPAPVPAYQPTYQAPVVITDARTNGVEVLIAWTLTVLTLGYMLPWAIAATRGKSNSWAVGLVNFLLGWTFIGWLAALVMACMAHQVAVVYHRTQVA
jgi:hypothetical protein